MSSATERTGLCSQTGLEREVAADIRAIFNAATRADAETLLKKAVEKYASKASKLAAWMEENVPESLTVFAFPDTQRRFLRTTNGLERLNRDIHTCLFDFNFGGQKRPLHPKSSQFYRGSDIFLHLTRFLWGKVP